jgi:prepilin-type N-terminal cleavage/methylation domain-containing protein
MQLRRYKEQGFTLVELLIVIVVIAILAAISIVAYNGIQNRATDTSVVSDLTAIAKKYELYKVDNDVYPYGATLNNGVAFKVNIGKAAYDQTKAYQLLNCTNNTDRGKDYAVLAVSKSGKRLYISSLGGGVKEYTGSDDWLLTSSCQNVLSGSTANGAGFDQANGWRTWTSL